MKIITVDELLKSGYCYHHTASAKGYISRRGEREYVDEYHGKYGDGYIVRTPRRDTNNYHYIHYYIKED